MLLVRRGLSSLFMISGKQEEEEETPSGLPACHSAGATTGKLCCWGSSLSGTTGHTFLCVSNHIKHADGEVTRIQPLLLGRGLPAP